VRIAVAFVALGLAVLPQAAPAAPTTVSVRITAKALVLSRTAVPVGQVNFAVVNAAAKPARFTIAGKRTRTLRKADPASARLLLRQTKSGALNHNGGMLQFGPDGRLYLGVGDGGNTPKYAQLPDRVFGKIIPVDPQRLPVALQGTHLFGDFCGNWIRALRTEGGVSVSDVGVVAERPVSFGEDGRGQIYIGSATGAVWRLDPLD
jgi:glucose/sorbosone dehydrogenase